MKKVIAMAIAAVSLNAAALTFESGEVLTTNADGSQSVVHVSETAIGQKQLEENGYVVVGNNVVLDISEAGVGVDTATVSVQDAVTGGDRLIEAIGADISVSVAEQIASGEISENLAGHLENLDESALADIEHAIENYDVDLDQLETVLDVLENAGVSFEEFSKFDSEEEARAALGDAAVDKIKEAAGGVDEETGGCLNAAGQPTSCS